MLYHGGNLLYLADSVAASLAQNLVKLAGLIRWNDIKVKIRLALVYTDQLILCDSHNQCNHPVHRLKISSKSPPC